MKKYELMLDKIPVTVITAASPPCEWREVAAGLPDGGYAVFIYPVEGADLGVTCIDENGDESADPRLTLAALSRFFKVVRHLPGVTLDVMICGRVCELAVSGGNSDFHG